MCIIIAKKIGLKLPDVATLRNCWDNNPDGAGVMYNDGNGVNYNKGFLTWTSFQRYWNKFVKTDRTNTAVCVHFRIATHGNVNAAMCHPFPISFVDKDLCKTSGKALPIVVMHNGIIQLCGDDYKSALSDTALFIRDYLSALYDNNADMMRNDSHAYLIKQLTGSKWAMLEADGTITTIGEFRDVNGMLYSNTSYMSRLYDLTSYVSSKQWDHYPRYAWNDEKKDYFKQDFIERYDPKEMRYRKYYYDDIAGGYTSLTPTGNSDASDTNITDESTAYYGDGYNYDNETAAEREESDNDFYNSTIYVNACRDALERCDNKSQSMYDFLWSNAPVGTDARKLVTEFSVLYAVKKQTKKYDIVTVPPTKNAPYNLVNDAERRAEDEEVLQVQDEHSDRD